MLTEDHKRILAGFEAQKPQLEGCRQKVTVLLEEILSEAGKRVHSVTSRVKSSSKLEEKIQRSGKSYNDLSEVTDQLGFRIITYYEDEVDVVAALIRQQFKVDADNSVDKRIQDDPEKFTYASVHLVCGLNEERVALPEYRTYRYIPMEIQIRSILQHSWAEMEHDWYDMQSNLPRDIKRRFSRLAGLLELADSEFLALRKVKENLERSVSVLLEANVLDISGVLLNEVSLASFILQDGFSKQLDGEIANTRGRQLSSVVIDARVRADVNICLEIGLTSLQMLRNKLAEYKPAILAYTKMHEAGLGSEKQVGPLYPGASIRSLNIVLLSEMSDEEASRILAGSEFLVSSVFLRALEQAREARKAL